MNKQKYVFLESEGDRWFDRNVDTMVKTSEMDPVSAAIRILDLKPKRVLEIGCSDGWRLALLRDTYGCEVMGVEPSRKAAIAAAAKRVPVIQSTASCLPVASTFDMVIYGFNLYLADPDDWLLIAAEGDCVLADGGYLVIYDFYAFHVPSARRFEHRDGVLSYHFDFAFLWLGNPLYTIASRAIEGDNMITVLKKSPSDSIKVLP